MLTSLTLAWRIYSEDRARTALANRLGPHLSRDIGIDGMRVPRVLPTLRSH